MTTLITLALCASASGQKLDAMSRIALQQMKQDATSSISEGSSCAKGLKASTLRTANSETIKAVVKLQRGTDVSILTEQSFSATPLCSDFAIVRTSLDSLSILSDLPAVERISIAQHKMELMLNHANALTGVDKIHEGLLSKSEDRIGCSDERTPFTGKGVMIGILDSGFDPNHAMFLDENGKSRFKVIKKDSNNPITDQESINNFTTDYKKSTHGTHVCGIAAGSFDSEDFQLKGVATKADLAMGPVPNSVADLEYIKYLAEYCKERNERLVINMSFGDALGPHDGSDIFSQAITQLIEDYDIVVCISAGNESEKHTVAKHTFTNDNDVMKVLYDLREGNNQISNFMTTSNDTPINMNIVAVNKKTMEIVKRYPAIIDGQAQGINIDDEYIKGKITIAEEKIHDGLKGYLVNSDYIYELDGYAIGFELEGQASQNVSCYADNFKPFITNVSDWSNSLTSNGTISNTACAKGMIVVGSYNSASSINYKNGTSTTLKIQHGEDWGNDIGDISYYSSFGTLSDGKILPHICAPGSILESSFNRYCTINSSKKTITRTTAWNGNTYSFSGMKGTSMSAPYMAGVAALWLEANPKLTHQEIKEIAMQTAINDDACNEGNHFINEGRQAGAGKIDAYAGLKYILGENEATLVKTPVEKTFLFSRTSSTSYEVFQAGATSMTATLYNIGGKTIRSIKSQGNTIQVNTANMPKGIYLLKVSSDKGIHSQKIAIR